MSEKSILLWLFHFSQKNDTIFRGGRIKTIHFYMSFSNLYFYYSQFVGGMVLEKSILLWVFRYLFFNRLGFLGGIASEQFISNPSYYGYCFFLQCVYILSNVPHKTPKNNCLLTVFGFAWIYFFREYPRPCQSDPRCWNRFLNCFFKLKNT